MNRISQSLGVCSQIDPKAIVPGTVNGDAIDMQDWDRVMFVLSVGSLPSSSTVDYQITAGTTSNGTFVAISGGSITQLTQAGTDSNKQVVVSVDVATVKALGKRYLQDAVIVGVGTVALSAIALGEAARFRPPTADDLASVDEIVSV